QKQRCFPRRIIIKRSTQPGFFTRFSYFFADSEPVCVRTSNKSNVNFRLRMSMCFPVLIKEKKRPETQVFTQSICSVERYTFIKIRNKICKPGMFMKSVVGISDHFHAGIFLFYFFDEGQRNRFAFDQQEIIILFMFHFF